MQGNQNTGQGAGQGSNTTPGNNPNKVQSGLSWSQPAASAGQPKPAMPSANQAKPAPMVSKVSSSTSNTNGSSRRVGLIAGAVVVVGLLVGVWITWGSSASTSSNGGTLADSHDTSSGASTTGSTAGASGATASGKLVVPATQGAGLSVDITSATVAAPTWIVVYETANGQPGRALGATLFFPETNGQGGTVSLLRATQPGQTYLVGESVDSGDRVFALHGDEALLGMDGKPVWYTFTTR